MAVPRDVSITSHGRCLSTADERWFVCSKVAPITCKNDLDVQPGPEQAEEGSQRVGSPGLAWAGPPGYAYVQLSGSDYHFSLLSFCRLIAVIIRYLFTDELH